MVISIDQAKEGMVLADDIVNENDIKLFAAGVPLNQDTIRRLDAKGYTTINVELTKKQMKEWGITEDFVYPTINQKVIDSAKDLLRIMNTPEGFMKINKEGIKKIVHVAQIITSRILASEEKYRYYLNDYAKNKDLISQSIRVAAYATVLAKAFNDDLAVQSNVSKINLEEIATAGLLQNFGSICENEEIRKKLNYEMPLSGNYPGLSEQKVRELKMEYDPEYISYYSYSILLDRKDISPFVKATVLLSKETENGKGPLQAKQFSNPIYKNSSTMAAAKILSICKVFDDILTKNVDMNAPLENTQAALGALFKVDYFSENYINLLVNNIPLYPVGTKVQLKGIHNGVAVVTESHDDLNTWHRPTVKMLDSQEIIDLRMENATIISSLVDENIMEVDNVLNNLDPEAKAAIEPVITQKDLENEFVKIVEPTEEPKIEIASVVEAEQPVQEENEIRTIEPIQPIASEEPSPVITPTEEHKDITPIELNPIEDSPIRVVAMSDEINHDYSQNPITESAGIFPTDNEPQNEEQQIFLSSDPMAQFGMNNYIPEEEQAVGMRM